MLKTYHTHTTYVGQQHILLFFFFCWLLFLLLEMYNTLCWWEHQKNWLVSMLSRHKQSILFSFEEMLVGRDERCKQTQSCIRKNRAVNRLNDDCYPVFLFNNSKAFGKRVCTLQALANKMGILVNVKGAVTSIFHNSSFYHNNQSSYNYKSLD